MAELNTRSSNTTSITRIHGIVTSEEFHQTADAPACQAHLSVIKRYWSSVLKAQASLVRKAHDEAEVRVHDAAWALVEGKYTEAKSTIMRRLATLDATRAPVNQVNNHNRDAFANIDERMAAILESLRLETTRLPSFDGNRNNWLIFHEQFKLNVHDKTYPDNIKMARLRDCLKGDALYIVNNINVAGDAYNEAWNTLVSRYANKRVMVNSQLNILFNYKCRSRNGTDLMRTADTFDGVLRSIRSLDVDTNNWDAFIGYLLSSKLDERTRGAWELHQKDNNIPSIVDYLKFLRARANSMEVASMGQINHRNDSGPPNRRSFVVNAVTTNQESSRAASCVLCQQEHHIQNCPRLVRTPPNLRFSVIKTVPNLCFNCLRIGHFSSDCKSRNCKHCGQKHNSALCRSEVAVRAFSKLPVDVMSTNVFTSQIDTTLGVEEKSTSE